MKHEDVQFKVIEEKRIVIAKINYISEDAIRIFNDKFLAHATSDLWVNAEWGDQKFYMPNSLKAVARCLPDDEFSVEEGKKIALKKLTEKYNNSLDRHLKHIYKAFYKCLDNMEGYLKAHKVM